MYFLHVFHLIFLSPFSWELKLINWRQWFHCTFGCLPGSTVFADPSPWRPLIFFSGTFPRKRSLFTSLTSDRRFTAKRSQNHQTVSTGAKAGWRDFAEFRLIFSDTSRRQFVSQNLILETFLTGGVSERMEVIYFVNLESHLPLKLDSISASASYRRNSFSKCELKLDFHVGNEAWDRN